MARWPSRNVTLSWKTTSARSWALDERGVRVLDRDGLPWRGEGSPGTVIPPVLPVSSSIDKNPRADASKFRGATAPNAERDGEAASLHRGTVSAVTCPH